MAFTPYENALLYVMGWLRKYHWTLDEVDDADLATLLDMDILELKVDDALEGRAPVFIDEVL